MLNRNLRFLGAVFFKKRMRRGSFPANAPRASGVAASARSQFDVSDNDRGALDIQGNVYCKPHVTANAREPRDIPANVRSQFDVSDSIRDASGVAASVHDPADVPARVHGPHAPASACRVSPLPDNARGESGGAGSGFFSPIGLLPDCAASGLSFASGPRPRRSCSFRYNDRALESVLKDGALVPFKSGAFAMLTGDAMSPGRPCLLPPERAACSPFAQYAAPAGGGHVYQGMGGARGAFCEKGQIRAHLPAFRRQNTALNPVLAQDDISGSRRECPSLDIGRGGAFGLLQGLVNPVLAQDDISGSRRECASMDIGRGGAFGLLQGLVNPVLAQGDNIQAERGKASQEGDSGFCEGNGAARADERLEGNRPDGERIPRKTRANFPDGSGAAISACSGAAFPDGHCEFGFAEQGADMANAGNFYEPFDDDCFWLALGPDYCEPEETSVFARMDDACLLDMPEKRHSGENPQNAPVSPHFERKKGNKRPCFAREAIARMDAAGCPDMPWQGGFGENPQNAPVLPHFECKKGDKRPCFAREFIGGAARAAGAVLSGIYDNINNMLPGTRARINNILNNIKKINSSSARAKINNILIRLKDSSARWPGVAARLLPSCSPSHSCSGSCSCSGSAAGGDYSGNGDAAACGGSGSSVDAAFSAASHYSLPDRDARAIMETGLLANGERPYAPEGKPLPFLNKLNQPVYLSESFARAMWTIYGERNVYVDMAGIAGWLASLPDFKRPEAFPGAMELYVNNCINYWNRKDGLRRDPRDWKELLGQPDAGPGERQRQDSRERSEKGRARAKYLKKAREEAEWQERQRAIGKDILKFVDSLKAGGTANAAC